MKKNSTGFSLIEVLVVVIILGILAAIVVPNVMGREEQARVVKAKQDIRALLSSLKQYKLDNFTYPSMDQGLQALRNPPAGNPPAPHWAEGGYVDALPNDPWGNPYLYLNPGIHGTIDVYTLGADGETGGEGVYADLGQWNLNQ